MAKQTDCILEKGGGLVNDKGGDNFLVRGKMRSFFKEI